MTREELINVIENSADRSTCPTYNCHEYTGADGCLKCAEKQLAEYERQIYNKGYNDGVARQRLNCDDCFYKLSLKADALKDCILENGEYCWQRCVAIEHCQECKCLGNGEINYFS